jgi:hypothetical protein
VSGTALRANQGLGPWDRVPTFWTHLYARLHHERLDSELAKGTPSWRSPRHAARALQLTSRGQRKSLAAGLVSVLEQARQPKADCRRLVCIAPCRRSVLQCESLLEDLCNVLGSELPLEPGRVARLRVLSRNGIGPFYCTGRANELSRILEQISAGIVADD